MVHLPTVRNLIVCLLICTCANAREVNITPDVVYGHKFGMALTFDVFQPEDANGAGVLFMVSGGWFSRWAPPETMQNFTKPLTDKGFTVFTVRHGSSPKYSIPEIVKDVRRSVRYIRFHADQFDVDQIGPDEDLFAPLLFKRRQTAAATVVVLYRLVRAEPSKETEQKKECHNRDVIGLRHNRVEIRVG